MEEQSKPQESRNKIAFLPVRNTVIFPGLLVPVSVGRPFSVAAVQAAAATEEKELFIVTQREPATIPENAAPSEKDLYPIGTRAIIKKMARTRDGFINIAVQGLERAK